MEYNQWLAILANPVTDYLLLKVIPVRIAARLLRVGSRKWMSAEQAYEPPFLADGSIGLAR